MIDRKIIKQKENHSINAFIPYKPFTCTLQVYRLYHIHIEFTDIYYIHIEFTDIYHIHIEFTDISYIHIEFPSISNCLIDFKLIKIGCEFTLQMWSTCI